MNPCGPSAPADRLSGAGAGSALVIRRVVGTLFDEALPVASHSIRRQRQSVQRPRTHGAADVDGALVGGASLETRSFADIIKNSI